MFLSNILKQHALSSMARKSRLALLERKLKVHYAVVL
jgi:hypothetical protein